MQKTIETSASDLKTGSSPPELSETPASPPSAEPPTLRERVRELLQAEVDKQGALDEARRAAVLIGEGSIRFTGEPETDFFIAGPDGKPRLSAQDGRPVPFSLADLAAELRRNYPSLFKPDAPSTMELPAAPAAPTPRARDWLMVGSGEPASAPEAPIETPSGPAEADRSAAVEAPDVKDEASRGATRIDRPHAGESDAAPVPEPLPIIGGFRPSYAIYGGMALVIVAILALLVFGPDSEPARDSASGPQAKIDPAAAPASTAQPKQDPAGTRPGALAGVPEIVDTSTLRIDGRVVRLFGVEWERGAQADDLTRYIAGREVVCTPAVRTDRHRCTILGRDLSEVVLYNGGGRATAEATPELKAAEAKARAGGFGIWQKP